MLLRHLGRTLNKPRRHAFSKCRSHYKYCLSALVSIFLRPLLTPVLLPLRVCVCALI
jgi:hypothetical protein